MVSSAASWAKMPDSVTPPFCSGNSSWSVASISASSFSVSTGGPFKRNTSERSPPSALTACTCNERVSESGLYCSAITRSTAELAASISTMPPLRMRGEPGKALMAGGRGRAMGPPGPALGRKPARVGRGGLRSRTACRHSRAIAQPVCVRRDGAEYRGQSWLATLSTGAGGLAVDHLWFVRRLAAQAVHVLRPRVGGIEPAATVLAIEHHAVTFSGVGLPDTDHMRRFVNQRAHPLFGALAEKARTQHDRQPV